MMVTTLKITALGIFLATSLSATNAGPFTNCKSKCSEERCGGDPDRKKDCAKKCPNEKACQTALSYAERDKLDQERYKNASPAAQKRLGKPLTQAQRDAIEENKVREQALAKSGLQ